MSRLITRAAAAVTAGAALGALGVTGVSAAGVAPASAARWMAAHGTVVPGARLWVARYHVGDRDWASATAVAVSPDGRSVYVTGRTVEPVTATGDYATLAYNAVTGARLWAARYNGPRNDSDTATAVAVSPDGRRVYVTGSSYGTTSRRDFATIAYNAATGGRLWVSRYNGPGNRDDFAAALAVSRDGSTVYVTGSSYGKTSGQDYATIAYNAATGARLWAARYNGPGDGDDGAASLVVGPDGRRVYVTGSSPGTASRNDYVTIAYNAATGAGLWAARYNGPAGSWDAAVAVAASPDGRRVYVTGRSYGKTSRQDYATIAYNAVTGGRQWVARYNGPGNRGDAATSLAVSPGGTVLVTGSSYGKTSQADYGTIAYSPTGTWLWVARYNGPDNRWDGAAALAAPGNGKVYVTGYSQGKPAYSGYAGDYATIAYNVFTGTRLWVARYNSPSDLDRYFAASVAARADRVFVTGTAEHYDVSSEYATVAYNG